MAAMEDDDDQSISDDYEFDHVAYDPSNLEGFQPLSRSEMEDRTSALSQLEMLQEGASSSVRTNKLNKHDGLLLNSMKEYKMDSYDWSHAFEEVKELGSLHEQKFNPGGRVAQKGSVGKMGTKFVIRDRSHKGPHSQPLSLDNIFEDLLNAGNPELVDSLGIDEEHPMVLSLDHLAQTDKVAFKASEQVEIPEAVGKGAECSMVELLDELCKKNGRNNEQNSSMKREFSRFSAVEVQNRLGCRSLDDDDTLLSVDSSTSSEEENHVVHPDIMAVSCVKSPKISARTILEQFHEACSSAHADMSERRHPMSEMVRNGYHRRLQLVVQREKNQHSSFQKLLQARNSEPVESRRIVVRILSRCLDAKLTVCDCLAAKHSESFLPGKICPESADNEECWRLKVIFSSTVCNDVETDEGSIVQIYPPWKEVQVSKEQKVLLCTYFSQVRK